MTSHVRTGDRRHGVILDPYAAARLWIRRANISVGRLKSAAQRGNFLLEWKQSRKASKRGAVFMEMRRARRGKSPGVQQVIKEESE